MRLSAILFTALTASACLDPGDSGNLVPKTVTEDSTLPRIEVAGTTLHAEAFGNPTHPMIVVLHGGPGNGDYRALLGLQTLANEGYYVVFFDQRGAGLSERHDASDYTMPGYLEDLRQVIEHYSTSPTQPIVFLGQSWGAMYATWFINEYGDYNGRLEGAVLTEPGAFTKAQLDAFLDRLTGEYELTGEKLNDAMWSRQFLSPADHARADYLVQTISFGGVPSEGDDPNNPAPIWRFGAVAGNRLLELAQDGFDWTTNLESYTSPILFIRGDRNTATTEVHQRELASSYPNAELVTIHDAGHHLIWERTDEYLTHVRAYFQQIQFAGASL